MSSRTLAVSGALLIVLAVPAGARAAVLAPLKPCYVTVGPAVNQREGVTLRAAQFTPNSTVVLAVNGQPVPEVSGGNPLQINTAGELVQVFPAPFATQNGSDFTIMLTEQGNPANIVTRTSKTSTLGVAVKPKRADPSDRVRFTGVGFTADKNVYAHYSFRGKLRKTVKMAKPSGPCGNWTSHRRQIPIPNPKTGSWFVQFDQFKRYVDQSHGTPTRNYVRLQIIVSRTFRH
jgi:hypothetical protein